MMMDRPICTAVDPHPCFTKANEKRCVMPGILHNGEHYRHPDAVKTGGCSDGCCDDYTCPNCKTTIRVELPD